jgi:hypothetical protein
MKEKDERNPNGKSERKVESRPDLQDASRGRDLSYLNEMPQMGGYEGVKAGLPPPKKKGENKKKNMADES